jgi:protein phosphatase
MKHRLAVCVVTMTDAGGRDVNEDSHLALHGESAPCGTLGLFAVADGMGGSGNGHTASQLTTDTLSDAFAAACEVSKEKQIASTGDLLRFAVQKANAAVFQAAQKVRENRGMGSTCVAAAVTDGSVHIAHVGDSRAYLFRDGKLKRLVEDQWVKNHGKKQDDSSEGKRGGVTYVDKAIGWQPLITPDVKSEDIVEDDAILVCTDGLTDEVSEDEIEKILAESEDVPQACGRLMRAACSSPESDNVTLIVMKFLHAEE